ncbi:sialic acid-binding Ig-like lectin 5 isoform X1 [Camelus dromedarius]|uniref:sialic acid-binding Ig-like lectin 5 isoform X1 n=1 Tax=Camelus dromedarius TaxID=9838 RepID=UPI003119897C
MPVRFVSCVRLRKSRMEQQRGLLLFLGVQMLLMGALLYQSHHRRSFTSFLRSLIQDKPEDGEELPFLVQVSSVGIPYQDVYSNLSQIHPLDISDEDLPNCPIISPYINGPLKVLIPENLTMEQVVEKNPLVELGGQYRPPDCWTEQHTAVVVPYCGQGQQLQQLLFHLHPFLQRQQLHYAVYVVNQVNNSPFNRGKLRNVGFWEAMQEEDWDCVFFHDVNLLPEDDRNRYVCDVFPAHVSVAIDKFNYKLPYQGYLGGVFALRPIHYLRINGFPNTYWGWDQEDNEIAARVKLSGMLLSRPHLLFGRYHMLEEGQYPSHKQSPQRGTPEGRLSGGTRKRCAFYSCCCCLCCGEKGADTAHDPPVATNKPEQKLHERTRGRFFLLGDFRTKNCSLSIRDVSMGDSGTYFFHVETSFSEHSYLDKMFSLKVTALIHKPHIPIPETLESGCPRNLTCSVPWVCEQGTPPIFSWTSAALTSLGPKTLLSSVLTLTPWPQDHSTTVTCQVMFPTTGVIVERTIQLNVTYAPQNVAIRIFQGNRPALETLQNASSLPILEGQALQLLCVADSNPPAQLSWFRGSPALNATAISSTAILELPGVGTAEEGEFTCRAQNPLGSQYLSLSVSVVYPPQLLGPSCSWEDGGLHCSCSSRAQPAPSLRWRLGEGLLEGTSSNASYMVTSSSAGPWANSSLSLSEGLSSGLSLSCEALNVHGAQSARVLLLPGQSQPRAGWVLGAVGGAGFMVLLSLSLCLVFRVKTHRETQPVQSMDDRSQVVGSGSREHQFGTDTPADSPAPAGAGPISQDECQLHYAFLRFHKLKPQGREGMDTEYSEIRTHK